MNRHFTPAVIATTMGIEPIRILDTGTRRCGSIPDGVDVHHQPALVRQALDVDVAPIKRRLNKPHHLLFYSHFAVETVASASIIDSPADHYLWAVGNRTAEALREQFGVSPSFPDDQAFEGLIKLLAYHATPAPLLAFGLQGRHRDLSPLAEKWKVGFDSIPVYASVAADPELLRHSFDEFRPHWMTLTSTRGAESVVDAIGSDRLQDYQHSRRLQIAAIGPSTAGGAQDLGIGVDLIPPFPDRAQMLVAISQTSSLSDQEECL